MGYSPSMVEETNSRRELFAKVGAAVFGVAFVDSASAKAGQFGKIGIFGMEDLSSPYQPGGPKAGPESTFGYAKSSGPILAEGYQSDVSREKAAFLESSLRIQAYNMRSSMKALNGVNADKAAVDKAYKKYWTEIEKFDLACSKKESALAQKGYGDVLAALKAYTDLI